MNLTIKLMIPETKSTVILLSEFRANINLKNPRISSERRQLVYVDVGVKRVCYLDMSAVCIFVVYYYF